VRWVGLISLYISCFSALAVLAAAARRTVARPEKVRQLNLLSILSTLLSTLALVLSFLGSDFRLAYVARHSARHLPAIYKVSALWAGQSGSLLLWLLIISLYSLAVQRSRLLRKGGFDLRVNAVIGAVRVLFLVLLLLISSPFELNTEPPYTGAGLNPMLQSLGMVVHPPLLFAGFSGFLVPFALAAASLWQDDASAWWLDLARPWALVGWAFLTAGIVTGGQWAYSELGWGGYWAWDPVENASLLPWLSGTALVHALLPGLQAKGRRWWSYVLAALTFALTIFGTFLTRSGVLDSVHAFSGGALGTVFVAALAGIIICSAALAWRRRHCLREPEADGGQASAFLPGALQAGRALLLLLAAVVFVGTLFPLLSRALTGREIALDASFFNQMTIPLFLPLLFLLGWAPLLAGGRAEPVLLRSAWLPLVGAFGAGLLVQGRLGGGLGPALAAGTAVFGLATHLPALLPGKTGRFRPGAALAHIGVLIMLVGIMGSSVYTDSIYVSVDPGEELQFAGYTVRYTGLTVAYGADRYTVGATLVLSRGGREAGRLTSEKTFWENRTQPSTDVGIFSTPKEDIYFNLAGWQGQTAQLHLQRFALVSWIWFGSWVICAGVLAALLDKQVKVWHSRTL